MDSLFFVLTFLLSLHDLTDHRLPNQLVYGMLVLGAIKDPVQATAAWGGLLLMGLVYALSRGHLGPGDVKLFAALSAYLGWPVIIRLFFQGFLMAGLVGVVLLATKRTTASSVIPLGPFFCLAGLLNL